MDIFIKMFFDPDDGCAWGAEFPHHDLPRNDPAPGLSNQPKPVLGL